MARAAARLRPTLRPRPAICAMGSPGSVDPKTKMASNAMSAVTTRRQPQPVMGSADR